jgi:hypothetical protein
MADCDKQIKREFFYAFLRNRLLAVASDFRFLMATSFGTLIGLATVRKRMGARLDDLLFPNRNGKPDRHLQSQERGTP